MSKSTRKRVEIPPLTDEQARAVIEKVEESTRAFTGQFEELESALGMLMMGRLVGWKVLVLIHNKRTIRKYEEILGIDIRKEFKDEGPLWEKSVGLKFVKDVGNFWKAVSGELKVEDRRELVER